MTNKLGLIIKREFTTRIRNRAFIVMSFLGPVFFAALLITPAWLTQIEEKEEKLIAVIVPDTVDFYKNIIPGKGSLKFQYLENTPKNDIKRILEYSDYYGIVYIPSNLFKANTIEFYTRNKPDMGVQMHITRSLEKFIQDIKLLKYNVSLDVLQAVQTKVHMEVIIEKGGHDKGELNTKRMVVAYIFGFMAYFFIFFFSSRVMRGVVEEKTNRIVEIMISSVKPVQLMLGKIIGLGLLGLVQFLLWMILTIGLYQAGINVFVNTRIKTEEIVPPSQTLFSAEPVTQDAQSTGTPDIEIKGLLHELEYLEPGVLIGSFLIFFILGYLLYASIFAAIGSAVDSDTDTQQFTLPVTLPLIIGLMVMLNTITNPDGRLAQIFSYIPLTSPIVMMARIPFGVPYIEIVISLIILLITFIICLWMSAKIYRVGILMYGKKSSFRELFKWLKYRN